MGLVFIRYYPVTLSELLAYESFEGLLFEIAVVNSDAIGNEQC